MVADWVAVAGQLNTSTYGCRLVVNLPREGLQPWYAAWGCRRGNNSRFALLDAVGEALLFPGCSGALRNREAALLWRVSIWI